MLIRTLRIHYCVPSIKNRSQRIICWIKQRGSPPSKGIKMQEQAHYAIGWGTLTLINAGLAQSKGRSGLLWWLVSLFFGPFATFLIVVLPTLESIRRVQEAERRSLTPTR